MKKKKRFKKQKCVAAKLPKQAIKVYDRLNKEAAEIIKSRSGEMKLESKKGLNFEFEKVEK